MQFQIKLNELAKYDLTLSIEAKDITIGAGSLGFDFYAVPIKHSHQRFVTTVTFLCYPGAMPQRWALPLVTSYCIIP